MVRGDSGTCKTIMTSNSLGMHYPTKGSSTHDNQTAISDKNPVIMIMQYFEDSSI